MEVGTLFFSLVQSIGNGILLGIAAAIAVVAIIILVFLSHNRKRKKRNTANEKYEINFEKKLHSDNFSISSSASVLSSKLYVDRINRKWILKTGNKSFYKIYNFIDLLSFEQNNHGTNVYLHINVNDPDHAVRSLRFENDDYALSEKQEMIAKMTELLNFILDNK